MNDLCILLHPWYWILLFSQNIIFKFYAMTQNNHIQAFVYADNWKSIATQMIEGGLYIISNFYTREALGTLRPTSSKYIINFSNSTTVQTVDRDDFMIPSHKFEFVDLSELFTLTSTYENPDTPQLSTGEYIT